MSRWIPGQNWAKIGQNADKEQVSSCKVNLGDERQEEEGRGVQGKALGLDWESVFLSLVVRHRTPNCAASTVTANPIASSDERMARYVLIFDGGDRTEDMLLSIFHVGQRSGNNGGGDAEGPRFPLVWLILVSHVTSHYALKPGQHL